MGSTLRRIAGRSYVKQLRSGAEPRLSMHKKTVTRRVKQAERTKRKRMRRSGKSMEYFQGKDIS